MAEHLGLSVDFESANVSQKEINEAAQRVLSQSDKWLPMGIQVVAAGGINETTTKLSIVTANVADEQRSAN